MATETQNPGSRSNPNAPGKPGSRQPPQSNTGRDQEAEGQEIPKTGRERDDDDPTSGDDDEDETGNIELPGEGGGDDQADRSRSADNP
jgi:hypothetical protein